MHLSDPGTPWGDLVGFDSSLVLAMVLISSSGLRSSRPTTSFVLLPSPTPVWLPLQLLHETSASCAAGQLRGCTQDMSTAPSGQGGPALALEETWACFLKMPSLCVPSPAGISV